MSPRPLINVLLLLLLICLPLAFRPLPLASVALAPHAPLWHHLTFHFFHAGPLHWLINASCLLSIAFHFRLSWANLLSAFALSSLLPCLSPVPVVGLSAVVFFLFGRCSLAAARPLHFAAIVLLSIAAGFPLPHIAALLHLEAFIAGFIVAAANYPAFKQ